WGLLLELPPLLSEPRTGEIDGGEVFEKLRGLIRIPRPRLERENALDRRRKPEVGVIADHGKEAESAELVPAAVLPREVDAKEAARPLDRHGEGRAEGHAVARPHPGRD